MLNETQLQESVEVQHAIDTNYEVHEAFEELKESMDILDHVLMNPANESVNVILSYSKLTKPLQQ